MCRPTICAVVVAAVAGSATGLADSVSDHVLGVLTQFIAADAAGDAGTSRQLRLPDAFVVDALGRVRGLPEPLKPSATTEQPRLADVSVRVYGNVALVNGLLTTQAVKQQCRTPERETWVLVRGEEWRLMAAQASCARAPSLRMPNLSPGRVDVIDRSAPDVSEATQLIQEVGQAFARAGEGYANLLADEFVRISDDGSVSTKSTMLTVAKAAAGRKPPADGVIDDVVTHREGSLAIVNDTEGFGLGPRSRYLRVFVKREGRWQMLLAHQTLEHLQ